MVLTVLAAASPASTQASPVTVGVLAFVAGLVIGVLVSASLLRRTPLDRDTVIRAAIEHVSTIGREQLVSQTAASHADLGATKDVIAVSLDQVRADVRVEMHRLSTLVQRLGQMSAERFGQVDRSLHDHAVAATSLADTTRALREALAHPQARGRWGERMADDVIRLAGLTENVSFVRQRSVGDERVGVPDYTFLLPHGRVLHMDVKFPLAGYLRHLDATSDVERSAHLRDFLRDVRQRVRELSVRRYAQVDPRPSVDFVVLFLPNEHLAGFVHEHDPDLIDAALAAKVVLCSPLTLYAFLGVVRHAHEQFVVEQTSDQILDLLGAVEKQWGSFVESLERVKRRVDGAQREMDAVLGTRRRAIEKPLREIEVLRRQRDADGCIADLADLGTDPAPPHHGEHVDDLAASRP